MKHSFLAKVFGVGLVFTLASAIYSTQQEFKLRTGIELQQFLWRRIRYSPLKQANYGVPFAWLSFISGVILPGYRNYSFYSFEWLGFAVDILIYGAIYAAIVISGYVIEQKLMARRLGRIGTL